VTFSVTEKISFEILAIEKGKFRLLRPREDFCKTIFG
jgi:hypothetical protein